MENGTNGIATMEHWNDLFIEKILNNLSQISTKLKTIKFPTVWLHLNMFEGVNKTGVSVVLEYVLKIRMSKQY